MKLLRGVQVLLVSAQPEALDLATVWLRSEGAALRSVGWSELDRAYEQERPHVLIADLVRGASAELNALRALARTVPTVALVARESSGLSDSLVGEINKRIVQPAHPADLVNAVATLAELAQQRPAVPSDAELSQEELFAKMLRARAERRDIRGLLSLVNASGPFRFTSVLRFDGEQLTSVWTYDRSFPDVDSFPVDKAISASYCARVRASLAPFELSDSTADPRVADHPARHQVMSYCGAPLWTREGTLYGTLCHFDESPRMYPARTMAKLEHAAGVLRDFLVDAAETTPAAGRP